MALIGVQGNLGYRHSFRYRVLRGTVYGGTALGALLLGHKKLEVGLGRSVGIYDYTTELEVPIYVN
ncbi:MAG: hypothetical protein NZ742_06095, partial [Acidobacteria bacterium]|nr:hypothetical protein [Acidobacteriota bacterium]